MGEIDKMDKIINLYKKKNQTSSSQTYSLRSFFKSKKAGHLGTLDPMATGVLPVFLGKYTKLISLLEKSDKTYLATIRLGACSDTFDAQGQIIDSKPFEHIKAKDIEQTMQSFLGSQTQLTPPYAAVKHHGVPAYQLARQGKAHIRKKKQVFFKSIIIEDIKPPLIQAKICCSAGTYIRTLADDLGRKLGSYALLEGLERVQVGSSFSLETSHSFDDLKQFKEEGKELPTIDPVKLLQTWHTIQVDSQQSQTHVGHGNRVEVETKEEHWKTPTKMIDKCHQLLAVGYLNKHSSQTYFYPEKVFI